MYCINGKLSDNDIQCPTLTTFTSIFALKTIPRKCVDYYCNYNCNKDEFENDKNDQQLVL